MIPELGHFALMLSLVICLVQGVLPLAGSFLKIRSWVDLARPAAVANALFLTIAFGILAWCFLTSDFTLESDAPDSRGRGEMTDLHHSSEVSEIKSYHMECCR